MSDKVYDLMESYLPKDVENIQKQYYLFDLELLTMWSILWRGQDSISKVFIVTKLLLTQFEIDLFNTSMIQIVV